MSVFFFPPEIKSTKFTQISNFSFSSPNKISIEFRHTAFCGSYRLRSAEIRGCGKAERSGRSHLPWQRERENRNLFPKRKRELYLFRCSVRQIDSVLG